jgi:hypothetical protein
MIIQSAAKNISHSGNPVLNRVKLPALKGGLPGKDFFNFI